MHSEIAESNPLPNKTPEVHDGCPNRRHASSHTSGPSAARSTRLDHDAILKAEACRLAVSSWGTTCSQCWWFSSCHGSGPWRYIGFVASWKWGTGSTSFNPSWCRFSGYSWVAHYHATWGFERYIAQSGLFHARSKMPGVVGGKIVFNWARVICSSKDAPWTRGWIDHDFSVLPTTRTRWRFHHRPSCSWLQTCCHLLEYMLSAPWSICTLMGTRPCWC